MPLKELFAVGVLAAAMFFRMFGVFVALPVAAVFAASLSGGNALWAVGIAVGGYGITQALLQIPAGMLADVFGRKPVLIFMLIIFAAGGFVAAAADSVWQLALGRLLQGGGAVAAVTAAWIADITAPERRAKAMLVYGAAIAFAFVSSLFAATPLAGAWGLSAVFWLSGWLGVLSAAAVLCLPSPPILARTNTGGAVLNRQIKILALIAFVAHYALSALFLQLPRLLEKQLPLAEHWQIYAPAFMTSLIVALPLIFYDKRAAAAALILLAAGVTMVFADGDLWTIGGGLAAFFAGFITLEALIPARASRAVPPQKRGAALGIVMSMEFFGMFAGAAISGALSDMFGGGAAFFLLIVLIAAGFVIILKDE